jgi:UDP-N-acetylmuramoyl-L-alanyl-D-glutamate--2,6-diaminopimelate ligase
MRMLKAVRHAFWRAYHFCLSFLAAVIYRFPSRRLHVIGITGTKGKTTAVAMLSAILEAAGKRVATVSSLQIKIGVNTEKNLTGNTMPGRFFLEKFLRRAVNEDCDYAIIEITSQGVSASRHRFITFREAAITNLSPEHIEAHGSFEKYRDAKASFLRYAARQSAKIFMNHEDQGSEYFFQALPSEQIVFYSTAAIPELPADIVRTFPGVFNLENMACAFAIARHLGIEQPAILKGLSALRGVRGRFEFVQEKPFAVVVDYAHTPDSLEAIYGALRNKLAEGCKLICVLGSAGGGRDKWKRPVMGRIAGQYCDKIILADEDPYDENSEKILEEIAVGVPEKDAAGKIMRIPDRKAAIKEAVSVAEPGDAVILTGKGSEAWIHYANGKKIPWDERQVVERVLDAQKTSSEDEV